MGQYYHPICLEKKEAVSSHDYGNGLKLMEHSWIGNDFVNVVENLIAEGGKWHGSQIVWAGDYADPEVDDKGEIRQHVVDGCMYDLTLYTLCSENVIKPSREGVEKEFKFLVNMDTKEFIDYSKTPVTDVWEDPKTGKKVDYIIHPLPLMTCEGNGRGGGDYRGENDLIGKWARNRVTVTVEKPKGHKEIIFDLKEDY